MSRVAGLIATAVVVMGTIVGVVGWIIASQGSDRQSEVALASSQVPKTMDEAADLVKRVLVAASSVRVEEVRLIKAVELECPHCWSFELEMENLSGVHQVEVTWMNDRIVSTEYPLASAKSGGW